MDNNKVLLLCLLIVLSVATIGGFAGYSTTGVPGSTESSWLGSSWNLLWDLTSFQVANMPIVITLVFDLVIAMTAYLAVKFVRGVT